MLGLDTSSLQDLRPLAEAVLAIGGAEEIRAVTHAIPTAHGRGQSYLLNLRGIAHAQGGYPEEAEKDFTRASMLVKEFFGWGVPFYNKAILLKTQRRFREMDACLNRALENLLRGEKEAILRNRAIAKTALGEIEEAKRVWKLLCYQYEDLPMTTLALPVRTGEALSAERVWVRQIDPARAQILSVVRFGMCQFLDTVLCDEEPDSLFLDGLVRKESPPREAQPKLKYLGTLSSAGCTLYIVQGEGASSSQAIELTTRLREKDLHIEVWSTTMLLPWESPHPEIRPLLAGLAIQHGNNRKEDADWAARELQEAARSVGLVLFAPALLAAAGDEMGAARHVKGIRRLTE